MVVKWMGWPSIQAEGREVEKMDSHKQLIR